MKKRSILFTLLAACAVISATSPLLVSCSKIKSLKDQDKDYDLGLATTSINSLNYIKYSSMNKILPTLAESPLKNAPNEQIKRILNLPEIKMGLYGADASSNTVEDYVKDHGPSSSASGRFYPLDQFGSTLGTLSSDDSDFQPVSAIVTNNNNILSLNVLLNNGDSKWSNDDIVTANDYVDALHYILDITTGSQRQTSTLQRKFRASSEVIEAQQAYIRKFKKAYINPFAYPKLIKNKDGKLIYDVLDDHWKPWASQNKGDEKEVAEIKRTALALGMYTGRLYWNYDNKTILSSIPYSPDFNPDDDQTIIMLPNPEYSTQKHSTTELKSIPKRIATKIRKYTYHDPRQTFNDKFKELLRESKRLKSKLKITYNGKNDNEYNSEVNKLYGDNDVLNTDEIINFDAKKYVTYRVFALDEYSLRIEYDSYQPTSLSNAYQDLLSFLIPVNRKFVESIGGITEFGLNEKKFLTTGPFNIKELVLGPQGYMILSKNKKYYSADKTISNTIKIYFSNDPNINSAMYDDGYIAATRIPAVQQLNYWSNPSYRINMKKSSGFGTIALAFNLDKETNGKSYIQDQDLRNAIYYAIDRNAMLNIVGWNSSYPVITWTAFGQGSSSFGDAVEIGFDHDDMKTKYVDKTIPVENYSHIDHLSKNYNFEHVDRTDKAYHLDVARAYLEHFKKTHPNLKKVHLKYISNSTDEQQNAGIALQDFMKKAFGDYVEIEIKGLPENVYEDARTTGQYDLLYRNFDAFGTDTYSYVRAFFTPDEINNENQKRTGFRNNPSGSWTYEKYFKQYGYHYDPKQNKVVTDNLEAATQAQKRLRIETDIWNKVIELVFQKDNESINDYTKRFMSFFTNQFTPEEIKQGWTERKAFAIITALEKIVRDGAPVVPLMEVDTYWEISRVSGVSSLFSYALQFAYDIAKPPRATLPTTIKEG